jgi:hypothetical protein
MAEPVVETREKTYAGRCSFAQPQIIAAAIALFGRRPSV